MFLDLGHRFFEGGQLPHSYTHMGHTVKFKTDFRVWLRYERLMGSASLDMQEKTRAAVKLCCDHSMPDELLPLATDGINWFHSCADVERKSLITISPRMIEDWGKKEAHISLFWDFKELWNSFKQQHNIDLYSCGEIHWWDFIRLVGELKQETDLNLLRRLRSMKESEFKQKESALKADLNKGWEAVLLERYIKALPEENE